MTKTWLVHKRLIYTLGRLSIRGGCWSLLLCAVGTYSLAQDGRYRDLTIPSGLGVVYPTSERSLTQLRDRQDVRAMRNHAWAIFSGLVQPAIAGDIDGEAVWETWYSKREVDAGCSRLTYHRVRELKLPLEIMAGYMLEDAKPNTPKWAQGLALAKAFFLDVHTPRAQVLYNFSACRHIRTFGLMDSQLLDGKNATAFAAALDAVFALPATQAGDSLKEENRGQVSL